MPEWMWYVIAIAGIATVGVVLWLIVSRGGTVRYGGGSIVINGKENDPSSPLGRALQYVQRSTPEIQHLLFRVYLRLMKDAGADPDYLADYDDARFVKMLLRFLVNGGNGTRSVQKIIEDEMVNGEWRRSTDDIRRFVEIEVWPPILRTAKDLINQEYDTDVLETDGTHRRRIVSNTDFVDVLSSDSVRDMVIGEIVPLFAFAQRCVSNGCKG